MEVMFQRCAGLDVHQAEVAACVRIVQQGSKTKVFSMRFETTPTGLSKMREWLKQHEVTHVAMEGTGVYWLCVYTTLEVADFDLTVCNAHHVKNVPGRKTDQSDAAWLAQLLGSGLLRKSYVPPVEQRMLRELTRERVHRAEDRARIINTLHRRLERVGVKLCSVVSDLSGMTARAIMRAMVDGVTDTRVLADLARGNLRPKRDQLAAVLAVPMHATDRYLLGQSLAHLDLINQQIIEIDTQIEAHVTEHKARYEAPLARLVKVPGIKRIAALAIVSEIGAEASSFDDPQRMSAWAGLAPGMHESAGKRKKAGTRKGNAYVRRILVQCAMSLGKKKGVCMLRDFLKKKMVVLGYKKAAVATAHKLLVQLWAVLHQRQDYAPKPPSPPNEEQRKRRVKRHIDALKEMGLNVSVEPIAA